MANPPANIKVNQAPDPVHQAGPRAPKWPWIRSIRMWTIVVSAFVAGVIVGHARRVNDVWRIVSSLFSHVDRSPVEWGIFIFLCAVAILVLVIGRLWWKVGNSILKNANSNKERFQVLSHISNVLLKVLRVSGKNAVFSQEPDDPFGMKGP